MPKTYTECCAALEAEGYGWMIPPEKEMGDFVNSCNDLYSGLKRFDENPRDYSVPGSFEEEADDEYLLQDVFEEISFGKSNFHEETASLTVSEEEIDRLLLELQEEFEEMLTAKDVASDGLKSPVVGGKVKVHEKSKVVAKTPTKRETHGRNMENLRLQHEKNHAMHVQMQSHFLKIAGTCKNPSK